MGEQGAVDFTEIKYPQYAGRVPRRSLALEQRLAVLKHRLTLDLSALHLETLYHLNCFECTG